jgi:hypothetical protein
MTDSSDIDANNTLEYQEKISSNSKNYWSFRFFWRSIGALVNDALRGKPAIEVRAWNPTIEVRARDYFSYVTEPGFEQRTVAHFRNFSAGHN